MRTRAKQNTEGTKGMDAREMFLAGVSYAEIARRLGCSIGVVHQRVNGNPCNGARKQGGSIMHPCRAARAARMLADGLTMDEVARHFRCCPAQVYLAVKLAKSLDGAAVRL